MMFLTKYKLVLFGVGAGAIAGYVYYCTVGCITGACAITSNPMISSVYGAALGGLALSMFSRNEKS